jgi:riboflavin kinase/FMN adenylyltransferase
MCIVLTEMTSDRFPPASLPDRQRELGEARHAPVVLDPPAIVRGAVVHGAKVGRTLGFPTANLKFGADACPPPFGIYAARVLGRPAAVSIGVRPTFGERLEPLLEAHIVGFDGDLYGHELTVELLAYLRDEVRFSTTDDLRRQILLDIRAVRNFWIRLPQ